MCNLGLDDVPWSIDHLHFAAIPGFDSNEQAFQWLNADAEDNMEPRLATKNITRSRLREFVKLPSSWPPACEEVRSRTVPPDT